MGHAEVIQSLKFGFMGAGNMTQVILHAFLDSKLVSSNRVWISSRTEKKLEKVAADFQVFPAKTNEQVVDECDVLFLAMKPQDLYSAIEPIASSFRSEQVVISLAAGIPLRDLSKLIPAAKKMIRLIPNTAARLQKSVVGYSATEAAKAGAPWIETLFTTLGFVVPVEDGEMLEAVTVAASSGIGFLFELMIYWKEWLEERGIEPQLAKNIAVHTYLGAAHLALNSPTFSLEELQRKVTSAKGVTAAGLNSMRELEIERALRISFEKAALRDKELGLSWKNKV